MRREQLEQPIHVAQLGLGARVMLGHLYRAAEHVAAQPIRVEDGKEREKVQERGAILLVVLQRHVAGRLRANRLRDGAKRLLIRLAPLKEAARAANDLRALVAREDLEGRIDRYNWYAGHAHVAQEHRVRQELRGGAELCRPLLRSARHARRDRRELELQHIVQSLAGGLGSEFLFDLAQRRVRGEEGGEHVHREHAQQDVLQHTQVPQVLIHHALSLGALDVLLFGRIGLFLRAHRARRLARRHGVWRFGLGLGSGKLHFEGAPQHGEIKRHVNRLAKRGALFGRSPLCCGCGFTRGRIHRGVGLGFARLARVGAHAPAPSAVAGAVGGAPLPPVLRAAVEDVVQERAHI